MTIQVFILILMSFWLIYQVGIDKWGQFSTVVWEREATRNFSKVWRGGLAFIPYSALASIF